MEEPQPHTSRSGRTDQEKENHEKAVSRILQDCSQFVGSRQPSSSISKPSNNNSPNKLSRVLMDKKDHQGSQNQKYIQKIYVKAKNKKRNHATIRKTDLGQCSVFAQQELKRLTNAQQFPDYNYFGKFKSSEPMPNSSLLKSLKTYVTQSYKDQIKKGIEWAENTELPAKSAEKSNKVLQFVKRPMGQNMKKMLHHQSGNRSEVNLRRLSKSSKALEFRRRSNKDVSHLTLTMQTSKFQTEEEERSPTVYLQTEKQILSKKALSKMLVDSSSMGFSTLSRSARKRAQIQMLEISLMEKVAKINPSAFLTEERIQALYECQLLRGMRKILGRKDYSNIQLSLDRSEEQSPHKQQEVRKQTMESKPTRIKIVKEKSQAYEVLNKNRNRIKVERKRVIQRLKW